MRDSDVRLALLSKLSDQYDQDKDTRVVEEMGVWGGSVRIDVAVINGQLHGYELKSERDTLDRLDGQVKLYRQVFDRVTLVTADRHIYKAYQKVPDWWGISIAVPTKDGAVTIRPSRKAKKNPEIVPLQVARLLWRDEAIELLVERGLDRGFRSATFEVIATRLATELPLKVLRDSVRNLLKKRTGWLRQSIGDQGKMSIDGYLDPGRAAS